MNADIHPVVAEAYSSLLALGITAPAQPLQDCLSAVFGPRASVEKVQFRPLAPGVSGAGVLLVESFSVGTPDIPLVVKFGPAPLIQREAVNFARFVGHKLRSAPRLLQHGSCGDEGVLVYELAGTAKDYGEVQTLKSYFESNKDGSIGPTLLLNVLDDLRSWHDAVHSRTGHLFEALQLDRELSLVDDAEHLSVLSAFAPTLVQYDLATAWTILKSAWPYTTFHASLQHGDLNVGNVLIDVKSHRSYVIDFASVQQHGPVFKDLSKAIREVILRLHAPSEQASSTEYLRGLESLFASLRIFLGFAHETKPLHDLPRAFESAFSLSLNFGPLCLQMIEHTQSRCSATEKQLRAEFLSTLLFQCQLILLLPRQQAGYQRLGALFTCYSVLKMLVEDTNDSEYLLRTARIRPAS